MGHITPGSHSTPEPRVQSTARRATRTRTVIKPDPTPEILESKLARLGPVTFPSFEGERIYMVPFTKKDGLPTYLSRWQPTVDQMLVGIESDQTLYIMIDQSLVYAGTTHRRPGLHVDGNWIPDQAKDAPISACYPETLILASDVAGCVGYTGKYENRIGPGGDCSAVDVSGMQKVLFYPNAAYAGNLYMIHGSVPLENTTRRTLVRINVPHHNFNSLF